MSTAARVQYLTPIVKCCGHCPMLFVIGQRVAGIVYGRGCLFVVLRAHRQLALNV